ncbi:hypothetical protein [Nocardia sp. NPDC005745]|uniref:hypothetical protein n=1 Tax=Nocardia sp. NPDC005745 TaxID=3157061 RepID=UPI00340224AC
MTTPKDPKATRPRRGKARATPDEMARQQRCADLAVQGLTYAEIAVEEGYASESGARAAVHAVFRRAATDAADVLRPKIEARAELLWTAGLQVMRDGRDEGDLDKFKAGATVADRALARLMRLYGLDQPVVEVNVGGESLDSLKAQFMRMLDGDVVDAELVSAGDPAVREIPGE